MFIKPATFSLIFGVAISLISYTNSHPTPQGVSQGILEVKSTPQYPHTAAVFRFAAPSGYAIRSENKKIGEGHRDTARRQRSAQGNFKDLEYGKIQPAFDGTGHRNSQLEYGIAHDFNETGGPARRRRRNSQFEFGIAHDFDETTGYAFRSAKRDFKEGHSNKDRESELKLEGAEDAMITLTRKN